MSYFLAQMNYTASATRAQINTPTDRESAARKLIEANGGKLHHLFFAHGTFDIFALYEVSDENVLAGVAVLKATGAFERVEVTRLYTVAENIASMKIAAQLQALYLPPN